MSIVEKLGRFRNTTRMFLGFGIIFVCFSFSVFLSVYSVKKVAGFMNNLYSQPFAFSRAIHNIDANIYKIQFYLAQATDAEGEILEKLIENIQMKREIIDKDFQIALQSYSGDREQLQKEIDLYNIWKSTQEKIITFAKKGDIIEADDLVDTTGMEQVNALGASIQGFIEKANMEAEEFIEAANNSKNKMSKAITGVAVIMLLLCIVIAVLLSMSILKPVRQASEFAHFMKTGDFTRRFNSKLKDEFGDLANALDNMSNSLSDMIREVVKKMSRLLESSVTLSDISKNMAETTTHTSSKAEMVSSNAEQMEKNAHKVAESMDHATTNTSLIASAAEEMTATINEIARNTENAREISENAVVLTKNASKKMNELEFAANDIGKVTETISEISEQTNLLALNATIEAARAGEAGKGFAVVANEIKELANQTVRATMNIKEKIDSTQITTSETISNIKKVVGVIDEINKIISSIASAVEEQSVSTKDIVQNIVNTNNAISEINDAVDTNTSLIHNITKEIADVNDSSSKMSHSSSQVDLSAENIKELASHLIKAIEQFKII